MSEIEEKLKCVLADAGAQVGELISCMIQAEIAAQMVKIQQLQDVLTGSACNGDVMPNTTV